MNTPETAGSPTAESQYGATLNPEYPTSWWIVGLSEDVKKDEAIPLRVLEKDLVIWRVSDGTLQCHAAHCKHLGAHLGHGGRVVAGKLECPFHGWQYSIDGLLVKQPGPVQLEGSDVRMTAYRVEERYGAIFLWNGEGSPDFDIPDFYDFYGISKNDYFPIVHRLYLPFRAKYFLENFCDAMHVAIVHGNAESAESNVIEATPTTLSLESTFNGIRPWFTFHNVLRLYWQGELANLMTPLRGRVLSTSFGATIHLATVEGVGKWGSHVVSWLPIEVDSHYFFTIDLIPRPRLPISEGLLRKLLAAPLRYALYTSVAQDFPIMMHRSEQEHPVYAPFDKGLVALRRFWDSRIESDNKIQGDGIRSNGARAGIRPRKSKVSA